MDIKKMILEIDYAILEIQKWNSEFVKSDVGREDNNVKLLNLLKEELLKNSQNINLRVLRGFKDVCTDIALHWEGYKFHDPIFFISYELEKAIPEFKNLDLLRNDFGKGNPI